MKTKIMQSRRPRNSAKKKTLVVVVALITTAVLVGLIYGHFSTGSQDIIEPSGLVVVPVKSEAKDAGSTSDANKANGNQTAQSVPKSDSFSVKIDSTSQSGGYVTASTLITGLESLQGGEKCVFQFEHEGAQPVVRDVDVTSIKSCDSGNIPEVEFSIVGQWDLKVILYARSTRTEVTKQVQIK